MLRTDLCDLLAIETPVVQAPIGSATTPELVAAVSNAGALGTLAASWTPVDQLRHLIGEIRARTDRPFAVNLVLEWPQHERLHVCLKEGVPVVSTSWGDPSAYVAPVHSYGAVHLHTIGSAREARRVVDAGVDVVVAQGWEAGGHVWGQVATVALVPVVADAIRPVPAIAAGGIADGRGIMAALALGASGAWIGTRFLLSSEARVHPEYQHHVAASCETDTVYGEVFDVGWPNAPHRALRNSTVTRWEEAGRPSPPERPGEREVVARGERGSEIVRYSDVLPVPGVEGDVEALAMYAGQGVGLVASVKPAAEIVKDLVGEAEAVAKHLRGAIT